jgi:hypothetical protein
MADNREESRLIGGIDAKKRAAELKETTQRERDESTEETLPDGSVRGRSVEYRTITLEDGTTKRVKSVVRYWRSAEAVRNDKFRG